EELDQLGDVRPPLAERRYGDADDVQAEEEVLAEAPGAHRRLEVLVGGGDDAHVGADRLPAADARELALLEDAQELRLERERHVGDLVQEQRAACGGLELADAPLDRAREGAALVAEELTLEELVRDGRAVERHEGSAARGVVVDGLGDQL